MPNSKYEFVERYFMPETYTLKKGNMETRTFPVNESESITYVTHRYLMVSGSLRLKFRISADAEFYPDGLPEEEVIAMFQSSKYFSKYEKIDNRDVYFYEIDGQLSVANTE